MERPSYARINTYSCMMAASHFNVLDIFYPGDKHELHPTRQINVLGKSVSTPSIVVHIANDDEAAARGIPR